MTALLPPPRTRSGSKRPADALRRDLATRRPLVPAAVVCGVVAAGATLVVFLGLGVTGWFLTDGGAHGTPRDGLRVGATAWLAGHGSGFQVGGALVSAVPLGITLLAAWSVWRWAHRLGASVSGHGPDADAIGDGERDWTVAVAAAMFTVSYLTTAVVTCTLAATAESAPSTSRVVLWSLALCLIFGVPAIAAGSGRAAVWTAGVPAWVVGAAATCRRLLLLWLAGSVLLVLGALVADWSTAANVTSQLGADGGDVAVLVALGLAVLPNATLYSSAYVLGPGFVVGTGSTVTSSAVVLGPLPMFPMLAALPDDGPAPPWTTWLVVAPPVLAFLAAVLAQRALPTTRWEDGALRGAGGGVLAGVLLGAVTALSGGAVGPGRMADVGTDGLEVMLHAVAAFGLGGLLGGLAVTWWQRRSAEVSSVTDGLSRAGADLVRRTRR